MTDADVDDGRYHRPAEIVGEWAAIDVDAGRQVRPDLRQRARDRGERALALAHPVARQGAQEADRVRELRALEHLDRVPLLHDLARIHDADPVAQGADDAKVVGDEQDRGVRLIAQRSDQIEDAGLDRGIETGRGLIEHEQLGIGGERHRDHDALLHPARELVRVAVEDADRVGDVDAVECRQRVLLGLVLTLAEDRERLDHLGPDSRAWVQGPARILVDHRGMLRPELADLVVAHLRDVGAVDEDPAAGDPSVPWEIAHGRVGGRGLAAAGLTDQAIRLARRDLERDAAQHGSRDATDHVRERKVLDLEGRGRARLGSRSDRDRGGHSDSTDCRPSAIRLTATTLVAMARAGNTVGHHTPLIMFEYS